ncbi:MAG: hypothetical protein OXP69_06670 [Spirochaetaceae bacterium]|nr:hypothetical protein [Spirochaetaceae bacterium]
MGAGAALSAAHGRLLVLADSAFPTGAFAHSWGLEWAVRRGWVTGTEDLYPWVRDALHFGVAPLEGRVVARAVRLTEQCRKDERALALAFVARAVRLSDDAASFLPSREARRAGGQLGRSLLAAAGAAFPELHSIAGAGLVQAARGHDERPQLPVAWGLTGAVLGIEAVALVQAYLLNTVRQWAQVAMRTIPIGQSAALNLVGRLLDDTARLAGEVVANRAPLASLTPGWDLAVAGHGELDARYFRS